MPAKAYILIETAVGKNKEVVAAIRQFAGVKSVDIVTGPYDIIAVIEEANMSDLGDLVTGKIHPIPGITRTVTCIAL